MKEINIFNIKQVRDYNNNQLAKFIFSLDCGSLTSEEFENLINSLKNKTLRKDRFKIEDVFYNNKYKIIDASSLSGFGYNFMQDFKKLFINYDLVK